MVGAANTTTNITVPHGPIYPVYNQTIHIENGRCVPLNATVDISSIGWGVPKISYYGQYETSFSILANTTPIKSITIPYTVIGLSNFYIDPAVFGNALGFWYQDYGTFDETAANNRVFKVNTTCPNNAIVPLNATPIQINKTEPTPLEFLPVKHAADILVVRGETTPSLYKTGSPYAWWVFGQSDEILDRRTLDGDSFSIPSSDTKNLKPGNYDVLLVYPGPNKLFEEEYKVSGENTSAIVSPLRAVNPIDITNLIGNPPLIEEKLTTAVSTSLDDTTVKYTMVVGDPEIQIARLDVITNQSDTKWYSVRGYTNSVNGTQLTIYLDPDSITSKNIQLRTFTTTAEGLGAGDWRQFNAVVPIREYLGKGNHYIEVTSPDGASQTITFYQYEESAPHFIPTQSVQYIGANPFIPPVTVIVTVPVPGPTQIVTVTITPDPAQIQAAQDKAVGENFQMWAIRIIVGIIALLILYPAGKYAISIYRRLKL